MKLSKQQEEAHPRATRPGSLLAPEAMGGINAGKGFDFQTRFAACQLPVWLVDTAFCQLLYEGTGDIDIRFLERGQSSRIHIQVKDHDVSLTEFKESLAHFRGLNSDLPGVYTCFTLVCPGLAPKLRPIEMGLARFRNVAPFYDDAAGALAPTKDELDARLRKIGLGEEYVALVQGSVTFEVDQGYLHHDDHAVDVFVARLLKHPEYAEKLRSMVQPAFAVLLRMLQGKRGRVLDRAEVEQTLRTAVISGSANEKSITVWAQNWTREIFDVPADYTIDWSKHFDRGSRRVPTAETWNNDLLPELKALREKIQAERTERLIRFRGKCALSTGVALGAAFPAIGGWTFEIPQPPAKEPWKSDASGVSLIDLEVESSDGAGTDLVLGLNIRGDGREDVRSYVSGSPPKLLAFMGPKAPGSQAIAGAEEAGAFARAMRERLGQLLKSHEIKRTRLFFYGPFALAVFLGQQLTSAGEVQLFEYQDPGYVPSCTLRT